MTMSLYHVSHVASGSMLGPPVTHYRRVEASNEADALAIVRQELGNPTDGEWRVQRVAPASAVVTYRSSPFAYETSGGLAA